jgi:hypothetical protein
MLRRSQDPNNWRDEEFAGINLDQVVTEDALRRHLRYSILVGKIPLDKNKNPLKKANTFEGPTVGGTDRPAKKTAQTKKKSSKSSAPKGVNPGVRPRDPPRKRK